MKAIGKGDLVGGLISAPFELAGNAVETVTSPLSGQKPQWVRDAQISSMKAGKPKIDDPAWRQKFSRELGSGEVLMATFAENLSAYKYTKHEKYLSHAEQLIQTPAERSQLDEAVLQALGAKAFDVTLRIDGSTARPTYREDKSKVLFISGEVRGATVHPTGSASLSLRRDLPFTIKDSYTVTCTFSFTIPRKSTMLFMGVTKRQEQNSVRVVSRTFQISPTNRSGNCRLDFGSLNGATTVAVLGSRSKIEVTGSPYTSFEITDIRKN